MTARVAPRLEKMSLRNLPVAQRRRLIVVQSEMDAERDLVHRAGEAKIGWRRVHRIAADDHEYVDLAAVHLAGEIAQRLRLIGRLRLDGVGVHDCRSGIAQRLVHRMRERVHER